MDMLKMIQRMTDIENEEKRKNLTESALGECGEAGMMPPAENPGNPVTMSVTLNASGKDHVTDLMNMLKAAGLEKAGPVGPSMMPMRQDMDRLGDIMRNSSMGEEELDEYDNEPEEIYMDQPKGGGINRRKDMYSNAEDGDNAMAVESDEDEDDDYDYYDDYYEYSIGNFDPKNPPLDMPGGYYYKRTGSRDDMVPFIEKAVGIPHIMYFDDSELVLHSRTIADLDDTIGEMIAKTKEFVRNNPEYVRSGIRPDDGDEDEMRESIKSRLLKSLEEKKSKPDFLDMDKDGNKKEPMKKALKDKKVKEAAKPDFLDMDKDDDKKEPMKKALKDKDNKKGKVPPQFKKKTNEAEVQVPNHEISDVARKAASMAQVIKRKINSGDQMDDRDYNQMAELGTVLSRVGTSFGPKSMKDVLAHMVEYTDDRNQEGHGYPDFTVDRFKELLAMAKSTGESMVGEISSDLAKRYTKNAKVDRDNTDHILKRDGSTNDWETNKKLHRRNAKRITGINRAKKRM